VKSRLDHDFIKRFRKLPEHVRKTAKRNYRLWKENPGHPSLDFKRIHNKLPIYSVRVGIHHRAVGIEREQRTILWFFIGSHADYDSLIERL
jgi:mRNA-degrading endonuclease RelE of RelBE toxin-antitoxin system